MHAYDFILILFSFVYAAAITHLLSTGRNHHCLETHPAVVVQRRLDAGIAAVRLRVVDRIVGYACAEDLERRLDRLLFLGSRGKFICRRAWLHRASPSRVK